MQIKCACACVGVCFYAELRMKLALQSPAFQPTESAPETPTVPKSEACSYIHGIHCGANENVPPKILVAIGNAENAIKFKRC